MLNITESGVSEGYDTDGRRTTIKSAILLYSYTGNYIPFSLLVKHYRKKYCIIHCNHCMTETKPRFDFDSSFLLHGVASGRYKMEHLEEHGAETALFDDTEYRRLRKLYKSIASGTSPHFQPSQDGVFLDTLPREFESPWSKDRRERYEADQRSKKNTVIFSSLHHHK